jgi:hypothetical protein
MSDLLIKPLRTYEDRGTIRDVDDDPYPAPKWLAMELEQLKLCEIVGEVKARKTEEATELEEKPDGKARSAGRRPREAAQVEAPAAIDASVAQE